MNKIRNFTDLSSWKEGHKLVLSIYKITNKFPTKEQFGLTIQLKRAAVSVTSNIAEGFSRISIKEKIQFYYISLGSVSEIQNQLIIAKDIKYLSIKSYNILYNQSVLVHKLINGSIKALKNN